MTKEEKQKAIDVLKISAPIMAMTQEKFNDYIQTLNKVMDWLEQEPCENAVSRQAVDRLVWRYLKKGTDENIAFYEHFLDLPSVTPQEPRWIPVSERLPENKETVLVTFKHFVSGNTIGLGSVILLQGKPHWHVREQNLGTYDVLAWMPLPKPYKAESESKE